MMIVKHVTKTIVRVVILLTFLIKQINSVIHVGKSLIIVIGVILHIVKYAIKDSFFKLQASATRVYLTVFNVKIKMNAHTVRLIIHQFPKNALTARNNLINSALYVTSVAV
jgi:hypothetical protein